MGEPRSDAVPTGNLASTTSLGGRYTIERLLGQGGMGAVYLAFDERLDIQCAIKEMSASLFNAAEDRERARRAFHEEAKLLARLSHPNLPRVTDHFSDGTKEYLVMEYVPGETLAQVLRRNPPPWSLRDVMHIAEPLSDVLHYLHSRTPPIIFRDLKPANVMRMPDGTIRLIDFGIARLFKPGQSHDTQAFGTIGYSAPEQYGQGQTDARSDVYSLGVLLHQLLTGHDPVAHPFNLPAAHRMNTGVFEDVSAVLQTATSHDPEDRFMGMPALRRALTAAADKGPSQPYVRTQAYPAQPQPAVRSGVQPMYIPGPPTPQQPLHYPPPPQQPLYNPPQPFVSGPQPMYIPGPPTPQQPLHYPPTPQQPLYQLPPQSGFMPGGQPSYPLHQGPLPKTTTLAQLSLVFGIMTAVGAVAAIVSRSDGLGGLMVLMGLVVVVMAIVALSTNAARWTQLGRRQATIGLCLAVAGMILSCVIF